MLALYHAKKPVVKCCSGMAGFIIILPSCQPYCLLLPEYILSIKARYPCSVEPFLVRSASYYAGGGVQHTLMCYLEA